MTSTTVNVVLKLRRDTATNWASANPVLAAGEAVIDSTANKIKLGDGTTAYNSLGYLTAGLTLLDEDNFSSNSATSPPSQQSTKAYVDTADALKANLSGATYTGNIVLDNAKEIRLSETDANGSHYLGFKAPDSVTADVTFTLPDGAGSSGQYLQSNGSGTLSWASVSSTPEGTAILSTSESGGTKFLREDGDGSCSWQSIDLSSKANLSGATFSGAVSAPSGLFTDDGSTAPVIAIRGDDAANWYGQINNDTYANSNTTGFRFYVADDGDAHFSHYGNAEYRDWSIASHNGTTSVYDIYRTAAGALYLYNSGNVRLTTTAAGITVTGSVTDDKGDVRKIIKNEQTGASSYAFTAADVGKCISRSGGNVHFPANNGSVLVPGDAITIINNSASNITIDSATNSWTMYNTADAATGNRILAARGMATVYIEDNAKAYISGSGLS